MEHPGSRAEETYRCVQEDWLVFQPDAAEAIER
jgi:hypothetical protein